MGKDTHLVNIYLKIHNKQTLTMDDLGYLAKYAPDCFEKTCKNVVYNVPEAKPIMEPEPAAPESLNDEAEPEVSERQNIEKVLENLKRMEIEDFPITSVDADQVKSLLGQLYMELLFPHNDKDTFINMMGDGGISFFDRKI